ncbi:hypothetical protein GDO81_016762 [Engystomops pustulosus]|uniref:Uncharacterized protein n=1 Tax=Engystomops pustulosus TaxID=76066 RepID=A0AAV7ACN0_ENGPU|nr:hypothetical protein GDO81_016762 [Engystomops pustulosus]
MNIDSLPGILVGVVHTLESGGGSPLHRKYTPPFPMSSGCHAHERRSGCVLGRLTSRLPTWQHEAGSKAVHAQ